MLNKIGLKISMLTHGQATQSNKTLYAILTELINDRKYQKLYNTMLYNGVSVSINDGNQHEDLLLYTILVNDPIAFDIMMIFGSKPDLKFLELLLTKSDNRMHDLEPSICDKIKSVISGDYIIPSITDLLENLPKSILRIEPKRVWFGELEFEFSQEDKDSGSIIDTVRQLYLSPDFVRLIDDATKDYPYKVTFVSKDVFSSKAACDPLRHLILIKREQSFSSKIVSLIFELCNAANAELNKIRPYDFDDEESYAKSIERHEFNSLTRFNEVVYNMTQSNMLNGIKLRSGITLGQFLYDYAQGWDVDVQTCLAIQDNRLQPSSLPSHTDCYRAQYRNWKAHWEYLKALPSSSDANSSAYVEVQPSIPLTFIGPSAVPLQGSPVDDSMIKAKKSFFEEVNAYVSLIAQHQSSDELSLNLHKDILQILNRIETSSIKTLEEEVYNLVHEYCYNTSGYLSYSSLGQDLITLGKEWGRDFSYGFFKNFSLY